MSEKPMNMNTDGAPVTIVISRALVDLTGDFFLEIRYEIKEEVLPKDLCLRMYSALKSDSKPRSLFLENQGMIPTSGVQFIYVTFPDKRLQDGWTKPILMVQLEKQSEGPASNIQICEVVFPTITTETVVKNEEIKVSWKLEKWMLFSDLYLLQEISAGGSLQYKSAPMSGMFATDEMTISPGQKIKDAGVFQCRNTLAYGNPGAYPDGNNDTYVLKGEWSKPVSMISKPVSIVSVICGKAADSKLTLHVEWDNPSLTFPVTIIIRSTASVLIRKPCQAGVSSFTFNDLALDPRTSYTVSAFYHDDSATGPESEPIPVLHRVPARFNLNYYENEGRPKLEARWEKLSDASAYSLVVSKDGVAVMVAEKGSGPLDLGTDIANSGQRITASIRAVAGVSRGPWSDPVPAPFVSESTFVFDQLGRLREVDADGKQKTIINFDGRGNITDRTETRK